MKILTSIAAGAALMLLSGPAGAAPDLAQPLAAEQRAQLDDVYELDNGRRVRLVDQDNRLYLEIGRHQLELVAAGPERLASRDGLVALQYQIRGNDKRITLELGADLAQQATRAHGAGWRNGRGH